MFVCKLMKVFKLSDTEYFWKQFSCSNFPLQFSEQVFLFTRVLAYFNRVFSWPKGSFLWAGTQNCTCLRIRTMSFFFFLEGLGIPWYFWFFWRLWKAQMYTRQYVSKTFSAPVNCYWSYKKTNKSQLLLLTDKLSSSWSSLSYKGVPGQPQGLVAWGWQCFPEGWARGCSLQKRYGKEKHPGCQQAAEDVMQSLTM